MKKFYVFVMGLFVYGMASGVAFADLQAQPHPLMGPPPTAEEKMQLDGWIDRINYTKGEFYMRDYRGFATKVKVKEGNINDFRLGDKVKVTVRYDKRAAEMIEKIY